MYNDHHPVGNPWGFSSDGWLRRTGAVIAVAFVGLAVAAVAPGRVQSKCPIYSNSLFFQERPYAKKRMRYEAFARGADLGAGEQRTCRLEETENGWRSVITRRPVRVARIRGVRPRIAVKTDDARPGTVYVWRFSRCARLSVGTRAAERRLTECLRGTARPRGG